MAYTHYTKILLFIFMVFLVCLTAQEYKIHQHQHQQSEKSLKSQTSMLSNDVETFAHSNEKRTHLELAGDGTKGVDILAPAPARGGGPPPGKGRGGKKNKNKGSKRNRTSTMAPTSGEVTESVDKDVELLADE